ncbi:MAG: hypothetical protein QW405_02240, partial [Fervidicoccaceae archaeon]
MRLARSECIVIFDFDGVLVDEGELPRVGALELLKSYIRMGIEVLILTGRRASQRRRIEEVLWESGVVPADLCALITRPDSRCEGEIEWKLSVLNRLTATLGATLCELHDDNPDVLEAASEVNNELCLV